SLFLVFKQDASKLISQSLNERLLYMNVSPAYVALQHISGGRGTIKEITELMFGIGQGQFVWNMQEYSHNILESWQFQPVHNVFLLIWSELGVVGLVLFMIFLYRLFQSEKNVPRGTFYGSDVKQSTLIIRQKTNEPREGKREDMAEDKSILCNKREELSMIIPLRYFKGILLGFIFILFFDHYFWDIQQGSLMLWMIMGFIAGLQKK
ncbi:MAG TPA: O-antigen ligase family protein, partial [Candidatus Moranbacteria bacterium]|nr:O-antigen ligase family protein [Candidatus Moranbacteria bacterium]